MAECHPVGFQWVMEAKALGAKIIHVDPRYTRTSAVSDQHVPLRAGSDIAFLGGIVHYILSNEAYFHDYVVAYTNAATILREDFQDVDDLDGVFSGYDQGSATYDTASWQYEAGNSISAASGTENEIKNSASAPHANHEKAHRDETMQHPRSVFQVLKRHYARYTPEMVHQTCGVPPEDFEKVCRAVVENSGREKTTAWVYSVGWTHHSVGAQYIRGAAIIQLLLGNMGRPGGGILALRGHASIQGSTDIPTLFNLLPGYLPMPKVGVHETLADYLKTISSPEQKGFWTKADTYTVSLLKAYWGDAATAENDYCFDYLPKLTGDHGTYQTVMDMMDDKIEGYLVLGQNPAVGSAHGKLQRLAMSHLKYLVVRDLNMIETATFWKDSPEIETGELVTKDIATEVFFFPAASHVEKDGTFTQTQRLLQWHHKAVEPPGQCESDLDFFFRLGQLMQEGVRGSELRRDKPLQAMTWNYGEQGSDAASADAVLREINGSHLTGEKAGQLLSSYTEMKADGSTAGGCWIYTGVYADDVNQSARRKPGQRAVVGGPGMGLGVAGEPAGAVQPRLRRPGRQALERGKGSRLVGCRREEVDGARHPGLPADDGSRSPAGAGYRWTGRIWPVTTRSSCRATGRPGCSRRRVCWTDRCPRTTSRTSHR